jgi:hypothetical protein
MLCPYAFWDYVLDEICHALLNVLVSCVAGEAFSANIQSEIEAQ